ncbi:MAG: hypothetical protein AABZ61_11895 [Bacteroidota bacterium]
MATIVDILLSFVLGGILLVVILTANDITAENAFTLNGDVFVQQMLVSVAQIVEGEVRNMGYNVPDSVAVVMDAQDTSITFLGDLNLDGSIDTVHYYTGAVSEMTNTQNDSDRFLYRKVNSSPRNAVGVVTRFKMRYFTQAQADTLTPPIPLTDMKSIKTVEITLEIQNPYALYRRQAEVGPGERNALFSSSMWRQTRLASQNLRR